MAAPKFSRKGRDQEMDRDWRFEVWDLPTKTRSHRRPLVHQGQYVTIIFNLIYSQSHNIQNYKTFSLANQSHDDKRKPGFKFGALPQRDQFAESTPRPSELGRNSHFPQAPAEGSVGKAGANDTGTTGTRPFRHAYSCWTQTGVCKKAMRLQSVAKILDWRTTLVVCHWMTLVYFRKLG